MNIQRLIIALIATCLLVSNRALSADTVTYEGIKYNILTEPSDGKSGTCEVGRNNISGSAIISPSISKDGKTYDVIAIGYEAFEKCTGLTSITIPASVTSIGKYAFSRCTGLTKLWYNAENCSGYGFSSGIVHWLYGCSNLSEVVIGENVKTIPNYFLIDCKGLTSITIPPSVTSIGSFAFDNCTGLTNITIPASVTSIGEYAFAGCSGLTSITIPASVTSIGSSAFYNCKSLTNITIPASVTSIGESAFGFCSSLNVVNTSSLEAWTQIEFSDEKANPTYYAKKLLVNGETIRRMTLPEDLTQLNSYAFVNCEPLVTVNCGSNLVNAGSEVFSGCTGLQRIYFPNLNDFLQINYASEKDLLTYKNPAEIYIGDTPYDDYSITEWPAELTEIPPYAFYGNKKLRNIKIPESVTSIGEYAFAGCENLSDIVIPSKISQIASYTFRGCSSLSSIKIPASLTSIGNYAFSYCIGLTSITIPPSVSSIGMDAFSSCPGLTSITIPPSVSSIGIDAFSGCSRLKEVIIEDINAWARIKFSNYLANPISYAKTFREKDKSEPIRKLDLKGIKEISDYAFYYAENLNTIRTDAEIIGSDAFQYCSNVTDLSICADSIAPYAFYSMTNLKNIHSQTAIPPTAQDNTFSNYTGVNLYVPRGAVKSYENAENCWWRFLNTYEHDFSDSDAIFEGDNTIGIENVKVTETFKVWSANGCVYIEAETFDYVEIYSLQGTKIHAGYGSVVKPTSSGVYILRVNDSVTKLLVK